MNSEKLNFWKRILVMFLSVAIVFSGMSPAMSAYADTEAGSEALNTITVNVAPSTADVTFYEGEDAKTELTAEQVTDKGVVGKYHQYVLTVKDGMYSYRGVEGEQNLGGMAFTAPVDEEIMSDGTASGKGQTMTLLRTNWYTTNSVITAIGDYTMNIMGGTLPAAVNGDQYIDSSNRVVTPVMVTARGNALTYQVLATINGELGEQYTSPIQTNLTFSDTASATQNKTFTVSTIVAHKITAPKAAKVQMFNQLKNFNVVEIAAKSSVENEDGTVTHTFATPGGMNLTYRVSMEGKITRAGYMGNRAEDIAITFDENENPTTTENVMENANMKKRIESSTLVNVNAQNNLKLATGDTFRLRAYRGAWQIINSDTANIMIEPDFNYEIISGGEHIEMTPATNRCTGNAGTGDASNWMDIKGVSAGTAIIEVSYDAIQIGGNGTSYDGLYGATDPQRKSLVVINVGETENTLSITADGASHTWDTEFDTVYYTGETGELTFTALMGEAAPEKAELSTDNGKTWTAVESVDGKYMAKGLVGGNNILKFTKGDAVEYQVVRAARVIYTIVNETHDDETIIEGDTVSIAIEGMYAPLSKFSGIYNPGFAKPNHNLVYTLPEGAAATTAGGQYDFITNHTYEVTFSATGKMELTNGHIYHSNMGNVPGDHRKLTDEGVGTNMSASNSNYERSVFPSLTFDVIEMPVIPVTLNISEADAAVVLTSKDGTVLTPEEGVYNLEYGTYKYVISKEGYGIERGKFTVGSADKDSKIVSITLRKAEGTVWDGETTTEVKPNEDGVYEISTGAELAWFAAQVNAGTGASWNAKLMNDISLGGFNWTPIGTSTNRYVGAFDGNGHFVTDLYINTEAQYQGLFGDIYNPAVIKNLGVTGEVTSTNSNVGGIVGRARNGSTIQSCVNLVDVTGRQYVGGIAGQQYMSMTITDCYNAGAITSTGGRNAGGISGGYAIASQSFTIENCYNVGEITAKTYAGGVTYTTKAANVTNSYFLKGTCDVTTSKGGSEATAAKLKAMGSTLGDAYLSNPTSYNDGYPILTWEEASALPIAQEELGAELDTYKNADDYRTEEQTELAAIIEDAKAAINDAKTIAEVEKAVSDAKAAMDELKTDAVLTAEELVAAKASAKEEVSAYKNAEDYREAEAAELAAIIETANAAIDAAETKDAIAPIVEKAKADMDALKTDAAYDAEELAAAKAEAEVVLDSYNYDDYRLAEKVELLLEIMKAKDAVDDAQTVEEVETAMAAAKNAIDALKTDAEYIAEELAAAKETAKKEVAEYKNADDYRDAQKTELAAAIEAANTAIDAAETEEAVEKALADAKAAMDAIKTDAQMTAEEEAAEDQEEPANPEEPAEPEESTTPVEPEDDNDSAETEETPADTDNQQQEQTQPEDENVIEEDAEEEEEPATGDNSNVYIYLAVMLAAGFALAAIRRKQN